jgi:hypothetical protein
MIKIIPLAFDSFGVRSMATYVETCDRKILIDPGVSLAPSRYRLPPHPIEIERMHSSWRIIREYAKKSDILIITHYHYDHHDPTEPDIYENKITLIKHPKENINLSQRGRAAYFLEMLKGFPKELLVSDENEFKFGKTTIKFSRPVCHGTNPRLGYVTEVSISCGGEKLVFTSDVEGPSLPDQTQFILDEKPNVLIVDGPMTYMLGYRYSFKGLQISNENLTKVIRETPVETIMMEHHFMRDLRYRERIKPLYEIAKERKVKVLTAAEFLERNVELLEARRRELYQKYG